MELKDYSELNTLYLLLHYLSMVEQHNAEHSARYDEFFCMHRSIFLQKALPLAFGSSHHLRYMSALQQFLLHMRIWKLKTGAAGEAPCVAGALCGEKREVSPGEVVIYSGTSTIRVSQGNIVITGGNVNLQGRVLVNGKLVMTEA